MQGSFSVWTDHKKGHTKVKELARFKPMQRHLFLHEKAVLFCKKREENGEGYEKAPSYSYKQSLNVSDWSSTEREGTSVNLTLRAVDTQMVGAGASTILSFHHLWVRRTLMPVYSYPCQMTAVGITENVKGDTKKFEIWYNAREEVYIIQVQPPTCPANQELRAPWGLFRVISERLPVRTRPTVFSEVHPPEKELLSWDTRCARHSMEIGSKFSWGARSTLQWLWFPPLSLALENFLHTAWPSGGMYGMLVLIGPWERGQSYNIGSGGSILSVRPKYSIRVLAQHGCAFHLPSESQGKLATGQHTVATVVW